MTAQPSLPLVPDDACPVGAAAAIIEDDGGGRVFVHGNLAYAWDAGDCAARRFAAVSLLRIKAATQLQVAEAFAVKPATVRRWEIRLTDAGLVGLLAERKGPKRKSKLTGDTVAAIRRLRGDGSSYRAIAAAAGVSEGSVRNALTDTDTEEPCAPIGADAHRRTEPEIGVEREVEIGVRPRRIARQRFRLRRSQTLALVRRTLWCRCWPIRHRVRPSARWRGSG